MVNTWYLPSFYGDVRLFRIEKKLTRVDWEKLTTPEREALDALAARSARKWNPRGAVELVGKDRPGDLTSLFSPERGSVLLDASLDDVRTLVSRSLKPRRQVVNMVKFADGKIYEESSCPAGDAVAGVTVAVPRLGCPEPRLSRAEIRARQVLCEFTTPEQQEDFAQCQSFVSPGAGTGHRYMVTSRHARDRLALYRRQLYDLDERTPYCVHDYMVPAAEEMLALHLLLQVPWGERYLRHLH